MKLSTEYITNRLKETSVHDLAVEIAKDTAEQTEKVAFSKGCAYVFDMDATVAKFEKMIQPYAPKTITAADALNALGVQIVRVK